MRASPRRPTSATGKPFKRVLSIMPTKYEDIWTAAKGSTSWSRSSPTAAR